MAEVFIPSAMRTLTGGERTVTVSGGTIGEAIDALDALHPGVKERLVEDNRLRRGLALSIDGATLERGRLNTKIEPDSKIYFVAATSGGLQTALGGMGR